MLGHLAACSSTDSQQLVDALGSSLARGSCLRSWARIVSQIWSPTRITGLSEFMAPCGISEICAPRIWRICSSRELEQVRAVQQHLAALDAARRL